MTSAFSTFSSTAVLLTTTALLILICQFYQIMNLDDCVQVRLFQSSTLSYFYECIMYVLCMYRVAQEWCANAVVKSA